MWIKEVRSCAKERTATFAVLQALSVLQELSSGFYTLIYPHTSVKGGSCDYAHYTDEENEVQ